MDFKESFIERQSKITDINKLKGYSLKNPRKSFRVNTLKISVNEIKERLNHLKLKEIPWCKEGFYLEKDTIGIGNLKEYQLGYIYIQEAMSMLPVEVLKPKLNDFILDMAASPGSKTTQIASKLKNTGLIVANDVSYLRLKPLVMNLERCGITNTIISLQEGRFFKNNNFDKILLDVPCSGSGTLRKNPKIMSQWSINFVRRMSGIQKQLIKCAFDNLKENGEMVYSTCSLEPEENENVISYLLKERDNVKIMNLDLKIKKSKPVLKFENDIYNKDIKKCLRIYPQDNNSDGFFVCKIKKSL